MSVLRTVATLALLVLADPAGAHGWYSGLKSPKGVSCCNDQDCRPVSMCRLGDREGLAIEGACLPIPWGKVLGVGSPDGEPHACWNHVGGEPNLLCVILPGAS